MRRITQASRRRGPRDGGERQACALHKTPRAPGSDGDQRATEDEIVVTARKREERLQDVPIAVTAVTGDTLEREQINSVREVAALTPGPQHHQRRGRPRLHVDPRRRHDADRYGAARRRHLHRWHLPAEHVLSQQPGVRRRAHRSAARPAGHAVRQQHAGRRDQRHHPPADRRFRRPHHRRLRRSGQLSNLSASISGPIIEGVLRGRIARRLSHP